METRRCDLTHSLYGLCLEIDKSRKLSLEFRQLTAETDSALKPVPQPRPTMLSSVEAAPKSVSVLLVEDNPADVLLVQESLRECSEQIHLTVAVDGEIALRFLTDGALRPDLVILDLNLPNSMVSPFWNNTRYAPRPS